MRDIQAMLVKRGAAGPASAAPAPRPQQELMAPARQRIGFIGLGRMGMAMATHLMRDGYAVAAYVRHPDRLNELAAQGFCPSTNIADLFDCDIVLTMLPDDDSVDDVVYGRSDRIGPSGLAAGMKPGSIHLSMGTISTAGASRFAAEHARWNQGYVAAPVFGNPDAARARELFVIAAGAPQHVKRCLPLFDSIGQRTFVVSSDPAKANLIKLGGNAMVAASLQMIAEIVALMRKRGGDPKTFMDIMTETMFGGRIHKIYGGKIVAQQYVPGFTFPLALKDVRLAIAEAEASGVPMPSISLAHDRLIAGMGRGCTDLDWSALGRVAAEDAGLREGGLP